MAADFGKIVISFDPEDRKLLERLAQALESETVQELLSCLDKVCERSNPEDEDKDGDVAGAAFDAR